MGRIASSNLKNAGRSGTFLLIWVVILALQGSVLKAQVPCNGEALTTADGYLVGSVQAASLFGPAPKALQELLDKHQGERYLTTESDTGFVISVGGAATQSTSRTRYLREVRDFLKNSNSLLAKDIELQTFQDNKLNGKITYIDDCVTIVPEAECKQTLRDSAGNVVSKCVDIKIRMVVLPLSATGLGTNVLNIARSTSRIGMYRYLPPAISAFNPALWLEHDKAFGLAIAGNFSANLRQLSKARQERTPGSQKMQLNLYAAGSKALNQPFYTTTSSLSLLRPGSRKMQTTTGAEMQFIANLEPQGAWTFWHNALNLRGHTLIAFQSQFISQLRLSAAYRRAANKLLNTTDFSPQRTEENAFEASTIVEGHIARGFVRGALWFDAAALKDNPAYYNRLVGTVGYTKQFYLENRTCKTNLNENGQLTCVFPKMNAPSLGLEFIFRGGQAWGNIPVYAQFFGGNQGQSFLYDSGNNAAFATIPSGPLIRSFGRNKAGTKTNTNAITGGKSFWNVNVGLGLPWPRLSGPLIPAVVVDSKLNEAGVLTCDSCSTLKDVLKNQVGSGKNIFIDALAFKKLSPEQQQDLNLSLDDSLNLEEDTRRINAEKAFAQARTEVIPEADKLWQELTPTITYIADHANIYAIKPIVLVDAARIYSPENLTPRTRLALGGGLQLNIVVARFEAAYLQTVQYLPGDSRYNLIFRMVFDRFQ